MKLFKIKCQNFEKTDLKDTKIIYARYVDHSSSYWLLDDNEKFSIKMSGFFPKCVRRNRSTSILFMQSMSKNFAVVQCIER